MEQKNITAELTFEHADLRDYSAGQDFDAVVGRYVLLYQPDPAAALRHLVEQVRPGDSFLFHELDFGAPIKTWPPAPLWDRSISLAGEAFRRAGIPPDFGLRLSRTFLDAGLSRPTIQADVPTGGEPGSYVYGWLAGVLRTLLPRIEQFGLATAEELQIDTLGARLEAEAVTCGCQVIGPIQFGAWIRREG
jgi:SAM-dependent methyltransferase